MSIYWGAFTSSAKLITSSTNGSSVPQSCQVLDPFVVNTECPSNNWQSIKNYLEFTKSLTESNSQLTIPIAVSPGSVEVTGQNSLRRLRIFRQSFDEPDYNPSCALATTPQAAVADALSATGTAWAQGLTNVTTEAHGHPEDQLDAVHSITHDYYQPYALVSCDRDMINGLDDQRPVVFPLPPGSPPSMLNVSAFDDSALPGYPSNIRNRSLSPAGGFVYSNITRSEILGTPGPPNENRLRWVELPKDPFNGTAIGAIILLPTTEDDTIQQTFVCNLAAGWGTSRLNVSTFGGAPQIVSSEGESKVQFVSDTLAGSDVPNAESQALLAGDYFYLPTFPQRTVTVTEEWAAYLNPSLPSINTTLFHHLMTSNITGILIPSVEMILSGFLANGLSGIGSTSRLQGTLKTVTGPNDTSWMDGNYWFSGKGNVFEVDADESKDWVKLRVSSVFQCYAYNTRGVIPRFAICILLLYCTFAIIHIFYAGITGISSTCWDSIAEVTALAVNSSPTTALRNTCAGITEFAIFKLPVRILAMRDEEGEGEHLELVFGNLDEKSVENRVIKPNRVYGTMPSVKPREKML